MTERDRDEHPAIDAAIEPASAAVDPVASTTLALLYAAQGHDRKARSVLESVLAADPYSGTALAALARLARPRPRLETRLEEGHVVLRWFDAPEAACVVVSLRLGDDPSPRVTSRRCEGANGSWDLPLPSGPAAAAFALARLEHGRPRMFAVAEPAFW